MQFTLLSLPGVYVIAGEPFRDERGGFVKVFHKAIFADHGIEVSFDESYFSTSKKGVVRGMHFQNPPYAVAKLVYVTRGEIEDVVLDLRRSSPQYGKFEKVTLSAENTKMIYVPEGVAHGFVSRTDDSTVIYMQSKMYDKASDAGILWNSFGMDWGVAEPVLSVRDRAFPALADFNSPFL